MAEDKTTTKRFYDFLYNYSVRNGTPLDTQELKVIIITYYLLIRNVPYIHNLIKYARRASSNCKHSSHQNNIEICQNIVACLENLANKPVTSSRHLQLPISVFIRK